jgi:hypothetical protein
MAARRPTSKGSKPPPHARAKAPSRDELDEESLDAAWFDDEAPTRAATGTGRPASTATSRQKPKSSAPPAKPPAAKPAAKSAPAPATKPAPKATAAKPNAASKAHLALKDRGAANAARLLPSVPGRQTIDVQVDWLENERTQAQDSRTIPVQAEWLEIVEEEPTTVARGRRAPVGPPPIPGPPPLPREIAPGDPPEEKRPSRRPSRPPPRGSR